MLHNIFHVLFNHLAHEKNNNKSVIATRTHMSTTRFTVVSVFLSNWHRLNRLNFTSNPRQYVLILYHVARNLDRSTFDQSPCSIISRWQRHLQLSPGNLAPIFVCLSANRGFRGPLQFVTSCQIFFRLYIASPDFREYGGEEEQVIKIVEGACHPTEKWNRASGGGFMGESPRRPRSFN